MVTREQLAGMATMQISTTDTDLIRQLQQAGIDRKELDIFERPWFVTRVDTEVSSDSILGSIGLTMVVITKGKLKTS